MVPEIKLQMMTQTRDSLKAEIEYLQALAASRAARIDSLGEQIGLKEATISAFEDRVQSKDAEIADLRDVGMNAQQMARTFATMSVDELSPIVARLSDQVVQDIYRQTANKRRKFLLTALGDERAAAMTNRLVKEKGS